MIVMPVARTVIIVPMAAMIAIRRVPAIGRLHDHDAAVAGPIAIGIGVAVITGFRRRGADSERRGGEGDCKEFVHATSDESAVRSFK
jgi:hypothetical protein